MKPLSQIEEEARSNLADFERMIEETDTLLGSLRETRASCDEQIERTLEHRRNIEESIEETLGIIRDAQELQR